LVSAPADWIEHLLVVLLDNAQRYTPEGGKIEVKVEETEGRVRLIVDDSGPGIPIGERAHIFDRFHRATDQPGGTGLGLAIGDAVVRSTSGRWEVGGSPLGGARMGVSWPAARIPRSLSTDMTGSPLAASTPESPDPRSEPSGPALQES
jgi:signal transduction histidine kinase